MQAVIDPRLPCPFAAGSRGKVAWLRARVAARLPLWHPLDNSEPARPADPRNRIRPQSDFPQRHRLAI